MRLEPVRPQFDGPDVGQIAEDGPHVDWSIDPGRLFGQEGGVARRWPPKEVAAIARIADHVMPKRPPLPLARLSVWPRSKPKH